MKSYLLVSIMTFFCVLPAYGQANEPCNNAKQIVMEKYWNGILTAEYIDEAIKQCMERAKNNDVQAQLDLSMLFMLKNNNKENEKSYLWTKKAAENNNPDAQFHLGSMYENGNVVEKNEDIAIDWYEKAANKGMVIALRKLGEIYLTETKKDIVKSIYWFEKAAEKCDKLSIIKLMEVYSNKFESNAENPQKVKFWDDKYTSCNMQKLQ